MSDQHGSTDSDTERREFIGALAKHRGLLVRTLRGISEEQARLRPTVSALCLGGLVKHVTSMEESWSRFITEGTSAMSGGADPAATAALFRHLRDDGRRDGGRPCSSATGRGPGTTDELVMTLPSLGISHPLPDAPWFEQGASWSARRVLVHVVAETAQHAGHADIIRETIDGQPSTMG